MEPVGHLCDIPTRRGNGRGIVCRSIAADDLHLDMLIQPCLKAFYIPVTEKVYDRPGFKADDNTAVCDALAKGPIIHANLLHFASLRNRHTVDISEYGVSAEGYSCCR